MGRGVFTSEPIEANTIVEIAPVIVMNPDDRKLLDQTLLHDYIFEWGENKDQCCMALGYVPIYNHSFRSNCEYEIPGKAMAVRGRQRPPDHGIGAAGKVVRDNQARHCAIGGIERHCGTGELGAGFIHQDDPGVRLLNWLGEAELHPSWRLRDDLVRRRLGTG